MGYASRSQVLEALPLDPFLCPPLFNILDLPTVIKVKAFLQYWLDATNHSAGIILGLLK